MLKLASLVILMITTPPTKSLEPFHVVLTNVQHNVYIETLHILSREVTPDCPITWSIHKHILHGGKQEGVEVIDVNNGKLQFTVVPTRGMSIQHVLMGDLRLGWDSPVKGIVHPKYVNLHSRRGLGWLEGFNEWMVRCGLDFFGAPGTDWFTDNTGKKAKIDLTLHGKIGNIPASYVEVIIELKPPYHIRIQGRVEETCMHGPKLELWAEISTVPGSDTLRISDKVTNRSAKEQEFGILYHANYGTPLMEEDARFVSPVRQVTPINKHSALDVSTFDSYCGPTPGYTEQVYCLCLWADKNYLTKVMLRNAGSDKAVSMAFSTEELPFFTLWKNPVPYEDGYVTGLEPGTGYSLNRAIERKFGRVPKLAPLQSRSFTIDFSLHDSKEQVDAVAADIAKIQSGRKTQINKKPLIAE